MLMTEQQFFEYIFCPARYELKYIKKIEVEDKVTMNKLLNTIARYFYLNLLNGKVCSINELKNKWDNVCNANPDFIDSKKNLAGMGLIISLTSWAEKEKIDVRDIDTRYTIITNGIELQGCLSGPLLKTPNNKIEMLVNDFNDKLPDQIEIDMKLKYSLDAYGFKSLYNKDLNGINIHSVKHHKDIKTSRGDMEFRRLITTINSVGKGIENKIFYPRENVLCSSCPAKAYCKYWYC